MRLEPGHRETVTEKALEALDEVERGVLALSGSGESAQTLAQLITDVQTLRAACGVVRDFEALTEVFAEFEALLTALQNKTAAMDARVGGIFLHAINTFRQAFTNLGTGSRTSEVLPKVLQDLKRVMATLRQKTTATPVSSPSPAPSVVPDVAKGTDALVEEFRESFLKDESRTFSVIDQICGELVRGPEKTITDKKMMTELFRQFHTVKGNALALGLDALANHAHTVEDALHRAQSGQIAYDTKLAQFLIGCGAQLQKLVEQQRNATQPVEALAASQPTEKPNKKERFFLSTRIGERNFVIPCEDVVEVLRRPSILPVPGGRKGWLGVIRTGHGLVPIVDSGALVEPGKTSVDRQPWVVVLMGKLDSTSDVSMFSVPVDDVGEVIELPYVLEGVDLSREFAQHSMVHLGAQDQLTLLDLAGMIQKIG